MGTSSETNGINFGRVKSKAGTRRDEKERGGNKCYKEITLRN